MLRISKLTDYATLILSQMGLDAEKLYSASYMAKQLGLSPAVVSKILKILVQATLLNSVRGVEGGYRLARSVKTISVAEVIAALEGDFAVTECCSPLNTCVLKSSCRTKANWKRINQVIHNTLSQLTIHDLMTI